MITPMMFPITICFYLYSSLCLIKVETCCPGRTPQVSDRPGACSHS